MSYAATISLTLSQATDATFRAWGSAVSAQLALMGLVQTADTGQVDWVTVLIPVGTVEGTIPYEMWRFNDAMQATAPIFIKLEFGTLGGGYTLIVTVGSGTNGAGTLTYPGIRQTVAGSTAWGHPPALQCSFSSDPDRLVLALGHNWLQGGGGFAVVLVSIERVVELPGVVLISTCGSGTLYGALANTYLYRSGFGPITSAMYPRFFMPRVGDGSSPTGQPITAPMPIFYGRLVGFSRNLLAIFNASIVPAIPAVPLWSTSGGFPVGDDNNVTYRYAISAYNGVGESAKNVDRVYPDAPAALGVAAAVPPAAPGTINSCVVRWRPVAGATGYAIYGRGTTAAVLIAGPPSAWVSVMDNFSPALEWTDLGVASGGAVPAAIGYNVFTVRTHDGPRNYLACYAPYFVQPGDSSTWRKSVAIRYE